jgi:hypothetical protein
MLVLKYSCNYCCLGLSIGFELERSRLVMAGDSDSLCASSHHNLMPRIKLLAYTKRSRLAIMKWLEYYLMAVQILKRLIW